MQEELEKRSGFSLLELIIAVAISSLIFYASYLIMSSSSDAYQITTGQIELQYQARKAASALISDLRQTSLNNIQGNAGWSGAASGATIILSNNEAIVYSSARDTNGDFITTALENAPLWQAIVVCAPFITPELNQLRRYRIYGSYDFPVTITNVSSGTITVRDASGAVVNINRTNGSPGVFDVLTNDFNQATFTGGNPLNITLNMNSISPRGRNFSWSMNSSATVRNQ